MAALRGTLQISRFVKRHTTLQQRTFSKSQVIAGGNWNPQWMPDKKFPETEEAIKEVSEKYNIPPDQFKGASFPHGDYPELGVDSQEKRNPSYHWDDYVLRRDWGEFVDLRFLGHTEDRCDPLYQLDNRYSTPFMYFCTFMFIVGFGGFMLWTQQYPYNRNFFDSQRPFNTKKKVFVTSNYFSYEGNYDRVVHYTFEPAQPPQ